MYSIILNNVLFPIPPEKIRTKINGKNKIYTLINNGEINMVKEPGLTDIDFALEIPFVPGDFRQQGDFVEADVFLKALEDMKRPFKKDGSINYFKLQILRDNESKDITFSDSLMDVTLEDYVIDEDVKYGSSLMIELKLKQYKPFFAKVIVLDKTNNTLTSASKQRTTKEVPENYTIKDGDTLCIIAQRELGDSNRWKYLYDLNKSLLEFAAKTNGKSDSKSGSWIFSGTVIKLR